MGKPTKIPKRIEEERVVRATKAEIDEEESGGKVKGKFSLGKYSPIIMPALMALAISFFIVNLTAVPKGTYNNAITGLSGRIGAIETSMSVMGTRQAAIVASIEELKVELANFTPNTVDQDQYNSLAAEVNNLEAQIAGLNIPSQGSLANIIDNRLAIYEARINNLEDAMVALQAEEEADEAASTDDYTLWSKELYSTSSVTLDYTISPTRVEDEVDYIIMVYLYNYDLIPKNDVVVDIIFSPKTGDRVKVDEAEVYLDSTRTPFYAWFGDIVKRSDGTTRRMVFTSEKMSIGAAVTVGEGIDPGRLTLRLEFTLAYK